MHFCFPVSPSRVRLLQYSIQYLRTPYGFFDDCSAFMQVLNSYAKHEPDSRTGALRENKDFPGISSLTAFIPVFQFLFVFIHLRFRCAAYKFLKLTYYESESEKHRKNSLAGILRILGFRLLPASWRNPSFRNCWMGIQKFHFIHGSLKTGARLGAFFCSYCQNGCRVKFSESYWSLHGTVKGIVHFPFLLRFVAGKWHYPKLASVLIQIDIILGSSMVISRKFNRRARYTQSEVEGCQNKSTRQ